MLSDSEKIPQEGEDGSGGAIVPVSTQLKAQFLLSHVDMMTFV